MLLLASAPFRSLCSADASVSSKRGPAPDWGRAERWGVSKCCLTKRASPVPNPIITNRPSRPSQTEGDASKPAPGTRPSGAASLRSALRGAGYAEGAQLLAPPPQDTVQQQGGVNVAAPGVAQRPFHIGAAPEVAAPAEVTPTVRGAGANEVTNPSGAAGANEVTNPSADDATQPAAILAAGDATSPAALPAGNALAVAGAGANEVGVPALDPKAAGLDQHGFQGAGAYTRGNRLGAGGMGEVFALNGSEKQDGPGRVIKAHNNKSTDAAMVKEFGDQKRAMTKDLPPLAPARTAGLPQTLRPASMPARNVARVDGMTTTDVPGAAEKLGVVMPNYPNGDLDKAAGQLRDAKDQGRIEEDLFHGALRYWTRAILVGLANVHAQSMVHSDIKPENIFLDVNYEPQVADFGITAQTNEPAGGSPTRMAPPEQLLSQEVTPAADVYAAGRTVKELSEGCEVTGGESRANYFKHLKLEPTRLTADRGKGMSATADAMTKPVAAERPTISAALGSLMRQTGAMLSPETYQGQKHPTEGHELDGTETPETPDRRS
ncbi:MAG: hypothetical protein ACI9MR_000571 [Myxococcota bacterium]